EHYSCCDALKGTEKHEYTAESAGSCVKCEFKCQHSSKPSSEATCIELAVCSDCGLEFGELDFSNHESTEMIYIPVTEANAHESFHVCCNEYEKHEDHNFIFNDETEKYTCICGETAVCFITGDIFFSDFFVAVKEAQSISNSKVTLLNDICLDPIILDAFIFELDLAGYDVTFNGTTDDNYAIKIVETAALSVSDSKGGGTITAPKNANLLYSGGIQFKLYGGTLKADKTVINMKNNSENHLYDGTLIGKYGIDISESFLLFKGKPEIKSTELDILSGESDIFYIYADLKDAQYTIYRKEANQLATLFEEIIADDTWFSNQAENRVVFQNEENYSLFIRYDMTKADISLSRDEYSYTASEVKPDIISEFEGNPISFIISYTDIEGNPVDYPVDARKYNLIAEGNMEFFGKVILPFTITNATPLISWEFEEETVTYTGDSAVFSRPQVILEDGDYFENEIRYSYRSLNTEEEYIEGLPVNVGDYEILASTDAFTNYDSAVSESSM
ncbi:MAG: hypothetical protein IKK88_07170, partial [Oscillospiraceae bacterium]|nr:hypothetical protein [Oscillospiraceae bacterium]